MRRARRTIRHVFVGKCVEWSKDIVESATHWETEAKRYRDIHDRSPDGMMIFRSLRDKERVVVDFEWLYCNASASLIVGRKAQDLIRKRLLVEMPGNKEAGLFDIYVRVVETGESHSHEFAYQYEGLDHWFRATSVKLDDGFYVAFSDLTARKRAEEQAARLAAIVQSSDHAIYSTSMTGIVETWNAGAEKLYGFTSAEIVGQSIGVTVPEAYQAGRRAAGRRLVEGGGIETYQRPSIMKDGTIVSVSMTLSPIRDREAKAVGFAVIARDVSAETKLQEQLVIAGRMASVGTLAAGMAHEINSPLANVSANIALVLEGLRALGGERSPERVNELERLAIDARAGAERITTLMRGLMTFSLAEKDHRSIIDIEPVLDLSLAMAMNVMRNRAQFVKDYGATPPVLADDARLAQVFMNLFLNAAESSGDDVDMHEIRVVTSTDERGNAVVEVRDAGRGIPPSIIDRLFDPFFTTKAIGAGTGLGLSICHNIVAAMNGTITAANNATGGATFRVVLPPSLQPRAPTLSIQPLAPAKVFDGERRAVILVVDDDEAVAKTVARVLRDHDVTVVHGAKDALALSAKIRFDLIISDLMMPGISGMELYEEIARRDPPLAERIVFLSGGTVADDALAFLAKVTNERLSKPFDVSALRALAQKYVR